MQNSTSQTVEKLRNIPCLVIDFEATCWGVEDHKPKPPAGRIYPNEIIEFGAVLYDPVTQKVTKEFQTFVRPVIHGRLTKFCTELTSIQQADIDKAEIFPLVLDRFIDEFDLGFEAGTPLFCSWGRYDYNQLLDDCEKHNCRFPFHKDNHVNLKNLAVHAFGLERRMGVERLFSHFGLNFEGTHHRGIDDARNIARLLDMMIHGRRQ